jgi:soluble lytic murein transglycosylase
MPRVPVYDNFQASEQVLPQVRLNDGGVREGAQIAGRQLQDLGNSIQTAGETMATIQVDAAAMANQLRVDDGDNQLKELRNRLTYDPKEGYVHLKGADAMPGKDKPPISDTWSAKFKQGAEAIAANLTPRQQQMLMAKANAVGADFKGNIIQHEGQEFRTYNMSVREGTIKTSMDTIALNYDKPDVVNQNVQSLKAASYDLARQQGKSAEWADAQTKDFTSGAHKLAINTALEKNNPAYADEYFKKYKGDMSANDIMETQGKLTKQFETQIGATVAKDAVAKVGPRIQTSDFDRAFNILIGQESGGRQFGKDGAPLQSTLIDSKTGKPRVNSDGTRPEGAIGVAQVMRGTGPEAAGYAGLEWSESRWKNDPDYNRALGQAYFTKQLQTFGSLPQAYAAYNAGPGAVQNAMQKQEARGGIWTDYLPAETQDYVKKNMAKYETGQGTYSKPTMAEIHADVDARIPVTQPLARKVAYEESTRRFKEQGEAIKQREDEATANTMRMLVENGGRYADLPASIRMNIPAKEINNMITFAGHIAKGQDSTNFAVYNRLATDQQYLGSLSDDQFMRLRPELSEADAKHFSEQRAKIRTGQVSTGAGDLNTDAINRTLNDRLQIMGVNPSPQRENFGTLFGGQPNPEHARIGAIRKFVNDSVMVAQKNAGKKFNDAEVSQYIDGLFAKTAKTKGWFGEYNNPMLLLNPKDIPSADTNALKGAFKRHGVDNPTEAQLLDAYWRKLTRPVAANPKAPNG